MKLFKEKVALGGFIRLLAGMVIDAKPIDLSVIEDGTFAGEELERVKNDLGTFRFVVLQFLFLDKIRRGHLKGTSQQLGHDMAVALALAFQDRGYSKADAVSTVEQLNGIIQEYCSGLEKQPEREIEKKGAFFFLCWHFSNRVAPILDVNDEAQRTKNFMAFDVAKQVYRSVQKFFESALGQVRVVA